MGSIVDSLAHELRILKDLDQQWPKQAPFVAELLRLPNIATAVLVLLVTTLAWRRYLSPLSDIPGPFWASVTRLWYVKLIIDGDQNVQLSRLHRKHGHFVRLAPNEVSVTHPDAVKKILLQPMKKGTFYGISAIPDWRYQTPMSTRNPKAKIERSKAFASAYAQSNVVQYEEAITPLISKLGQWMTRYAESGEPMELNLSPGSMLMETAVAALREREKNPDARFDMAAHWLRYLEQHPDRTTYRNVEAQTTTNVGAGADTTSCALQSILYHMARHPETWRRARAEIDEAQQQGRCQSAVISLADAQGLPYLQACIKEALRIHAPVPMGLPRVAPKDGITIGNRTFPEGTTLSINPWVLHHSQELWGQDADQWNPDRWLGDDAAALDKNWIPFGAGWMGCPGQHVARMELSKVCSTVVRDFDIELVDPSKEWHWMAYFTMVPSTWPVYVSKRASGGVI